MQLVNSSVFLIITISISQIVGEISNGEIDMSRRGVQTNISANFKTEPDTINVDKIINLKNFQTSPLISVELNTLHSNSGDTLNLHHNFTNLIRISNILDVFNIERIGTEWDAVSREISANCSTDMIEYLQGLQTSKIWAVKSK